MRRRSSALIVAVAAVMVAGCSEGGGTEVGPSPDAPVTTAAAQIGPPSDVSSPAGGAETSGPATSGTATGSSPDASIATTEVTAGDDDLVGLVLTAPEGWASSADGLVVAEGDGDLTGPDPRGPRIVDVTGMDEAAYASFVPEPSDVGGQLSREPEQLVVAGFEALAVTFTDPMPSGRSLATTTLIVELPGGTARVFVLQAPADTAAETEPVLLAAIRSG